MPVDVPETRFARVGDDRIAYQVFGEGPVDLLWIIGMFETLDGRWDWPPYAHFLRRVGSFSRVITFDRRGSGASDRVSRAGLPVWEDWTDDARAVLDAVGSQRAAVYASTDAGAVGIWFAATEPERTQALVLYCASARARGRRWLPRRVAGGARRRRVRLHHRDVGHGGLGRVRVTDRSTGRGGITKNVGPHTLRHTFITAALDAGVPLRDVQEAASHADPRTTMRYDRGRQSLDRHATYIVATFVAGASR